MIHKPPRSTFFSYTTLFRSHYKAGGVSQLWSYRSESRPTVLKPSPRMSSALSDDPAPLPLSELGSRSEEHTSELQSRGHLVCRLLLEKKKNLEPLPSMRLPT